MMMMMIKERNIFRSHQIINEMNISNIFVVCEQLCLVGK